ncbi:MAG TPA: hypothetical protein VN030_03530 [Cellvibrio sp.]|nr:hypothetical protein [Cellvibrio sp.]
MGTTELAEDEVLLELETEAVLEETLLADDLELDRLLRLELTTEELTNEELTATTEELTNEELTVTSEELTTTAEELLAGGMTISLDTELELGAASEAATAELNARLALLLANEASDEETAATLELTGATEAWLMATPTELFEDWLDAATEELAGVLLTGADLLPPPPPQALNAKASTATDNALSEYILILSMIVLLI